MKKFLEALQRVASEPRFGFDLVRMYLGVALFVRGALFIADPTRVLAFMSKSSDWFWPVLIAHYVGIAHVGGGILLALGLATRIAALVQVPVLVGAVFQVHLHEPLLHGNQSLELASLVLVLLLAYGVFGAGPLSLDHRVIRHGVNPDVWSRIRTHRRHRRAGAVAG
jgi:putative oxidoreductase